MERKVRNDGITKSKYKIEVQEFIDEQLKQ